MGCSKGSSKREVYSNTILPQETKKKKKKKHRVDNLNLHVKQLEKEEQKKPSKLVEGKTSRRSEQI